MQKFHLKLIFHKDTASSRRASAPSAAPDQVSRDAAASFVLQLDESKQLVRELLQTECFLIGNIDIMISHLLIQIRPRRTQPR